MPCISSTSIGWWFMVLFVIRILYCQDCFFSICWNVIPIHVWMKIIITSDIDKQNVPDVLLTRAPPPSLCLFIHTFHYSTFSHLSSYQNSNLQFPNQFLIETMLQHFSASTHIVADTDLQIHNSKHSNFKENCFFADFFICRISERFSSRIAPKSWSFVICNSQRRIFRSLNRNTAEGCTFSILTPVLPFL